MLTVAAITAYFLFAGDTMPKNEPNRVIEKVQIVASPIQEPQIPSSSKFQMGVGILYGYGGDKDNLELRLSTLFEYLKQLGITHVSMNFPVYQDNWQASVVWRDSLFTPSHESMATFIREAHKKGLIVMVRPLLDEKTIHTTPGKWKGVIEPKDRKQWMTTYGDILVDFAKTAERENAEIISIGAEFSSLENETALWIEMIQRVRNVYSGQVTYAVDWHQMYDLEFASYLDFVSLDAYFPMEAGADATKDELVREMKDWAVMLSRATSTYGKPFVVTEVGIRSEQGSYAESWNWDLGTPVDLNRQALYYQAFCEAVKPAIGGAYWWFVDLDLPKNPLTDRGWNPLGKPAESVLRNNC